MPQNSIKDLQKQLKEVEKALRELDGGLCNVQFDPDDPSSIEGAIRSVKDTINRKIERYRKNPLVKPMAEKIQERMEKEIRAKARAARQMKADDRLLERNGQGGDGDETDGSQDDEVNG